MGIWVGEIPQQRVLTPVGWPRKALRHVCVDTFTRGTSRQDYTDAILRVGAHHISRESQIWFWVGHTPSMWGFLAAPEWGKSLHQGAWLEGFSVKCKALSSYFILMNAIRKGKIWKSVLCLHGSQKISRSLYWMITFCSREDYVFGCQEIVSGVRTYFLRKPYWMSSFKYLRWAQ